MTQVYRHGHTGIALLAYAPIAYGLLKLNHPALALLRGIGVLAVEPLPDRDQGIRGITLEGAPEDARQALVETRPISVTPVANAELREYTTVIDEFSIHDSLIVASHRAQNADAILTTDGVICDAGYQTIWD